MAAAAIASCGDADDDFGDDLYADLDAFVSAPPAPVVHGDSLDATDSAVVADCSEDTESSSESDDDLRIVLNEDGGGMSQGSGVAEMARTLGDDEKEGSTLQGLDGGRRERADLSVATFHGRNTVGPFSNGRIPTPSCGDWDHHQSHSPSQKGFCFYLPRNRSVFDIDIEAFVEKPWRRCGVDVTDYFNFGLDEESWKSYCHALDQFRQKTMNNLNNAGLDEESQIDQENSEAMHGKPKGRAIYVESEFCERLPSADLRPPRYSDFDDVIHINMETSMDDKCSSDKSELEHVNNKNNTLSVNPDNVKSDGNNCDNYDEECAHFSGSVPGTIPTKEVDSSCSVEVTEDVKTSLHENNTCAKLNGLLSGDKAATISRSGEITRSEGSEDEKHIKGTAKLADAKSSSENADFQEPTELDCILSNCSSDNAHKVEDSGRCDTYSHTSSPVENPSCKTDISRSRTDFSNPGKGKSKKHYLSSPGKGKSKKHSMAHDNGLENRHVDYKLTRRKSKSSSIAKRTVVNENDMNGSAALSSKRHSEGRNHSTIRSRHSEGRNESSTLSKQCSEDVRLSAAKGTAHDENNTVHKYDKYIWKEKDPKDIASQRTKKRRSQCLNKFPKKKCRINAPNEFMDYHAPSDLRVLHDKRGRHHYMLDVDVASDADEDICRIPSNGKHRIDASNGHINDCLDDRYRRAQLRKSRHPYRQIALPENDENTEHHKLPFFHHTEGDFPCSEVSLSESEQLENFPFHSSYVGRHLDSKRTLSTKRLHARRRLLKDMGYERECFVNNMDEITLYRGTFIDNESRDSISTRRFGNRSVLMQNGSARRFDNKPFLLQNDSARFDNKSFLVQSDAAGLQYQREQRFSHEFVKQLVTTDADIYNGYEEDDFMGPPINGNTNLGDSGHSSFVTNYIVGRRCEPYALGHEDAEIEHVNDWRRQGAGGYEATSSSRGVPAVNTENSDPRRIAGFRRKPRMPRMERSFLVNKNLEDTEPCSFGSTLERKHNMDHPNTQSIRDAEIEEGEVVEEPDFPLKGNPKPAKIKSAIEIPKSKPEAACSNKVSHNVGFDDKHLLEALAKMEKRKQRFGEPLLATKIEAEISEGLLQASTTDELKDRPVRKRRWGGV